MLLVISDVTPLTKQCLPMFGVLQELNPAIELLAEDDRFCCYHDRAAAAAADADHPCPLGDPRVPLSAERRVLISLLLLLEVGFEPTRLFRFP